MKKIFLFLFLFSCQAFACPDMNGHWTYSGVGLSSDLKVNEPDCTAANLTMVNVILGVSRTLIYNCPLDGVKREMPPPTPNEKDMASAQFVGDHALIYVDEYFQDGSMLRNKFDAVLLSALQLQVTQSVLNAQGLPTFTKVAVFNKQP
jgi:hypothetical protein